MALRKSSVNSEVMGGRTEETSINKRWSVQGQNYVQTWFLTTLVHGTDEKQIEWKHTKFTRESGCQKETPGLSA